MSKGKLLALCVVWLLIVGGVAVAWKIIVAKRAEERDERIVGLSQYDHVVDFALDQFSGYAVLRSPEFEDQLRQHKIKVSLTDDGADYRRRLANLESGDVDMAVFTVDALIKSCAELGDRPPALIVSIIDETRGADAMLANKHTIPNVEALNNPETRFVLTGDSPSETLARVVMSDFQLDQLADDPFILTKSPEETMERYRQSKSNSREVFVIWEPYVSQILKNQNMHVVIDSSRFRGRIVDVIVVSKDFLAKNPDVVEDVVGSYFAAAYKYRQKMSQLVRDDAKRMKTPLTEEEAEKLTHGIRWKNTKDNFAHFGIQPSGQIQHIEDMIDRITQVLMKTEAIDRDPTEGRPNRLYYDKILASLAEKNFHPGLDSERVQDDKIVLPVLSDTEWDDLQEVGELKVSDLVFPRGRSDLSGNSYAILDELVETLNTYPQYYVLVRGNAALRGDIEANKILAEARAKAAADYLIKQGIHPNRIRAKGSDPTGTTSVSFVLGEAPY